MNKAQLTLLSLVLLIITSCCPKRECRSAQDTNEIQFYNFTLEEIDSLIFKSYAPNSSTPTSVDSTNYRLSDAGNNSVIVYLNQAIDINLKWDIVVKSIHKTYTLSDFVTAPVVCNKCWFGSHSDQVMQVQSYQVNGQTETDQVISIYR